jgi:hypothetical protein
VSRVWAGFSGTAELPWLRVLKPGFRHCFAVLDDGRHWLVLDPLAPRTDLRALDRAEVPDLPEHLRRRGLTVIEARLRHPVRPAPWRPFTCVEAVKRLIGLDAPFVFTPWQLYRRLARETPPETDR